MNIDWRPIEQADKIEGRYYFGFDRASAAAFGKAEAGICIIHWCESDEDEIAEGMPSEWLVQPIYWNGDYVFGDLDLTHFAEMIAPPADAATIPGVFDEAVVQ